MLILLLSYLRSLLISRACMAAEVLALRHQIMVLRRSVPRARLRRTDRAFWVILRRIWSGSRDVLVIVEPATVVRWHREWHRVRIPDLLAL